MTPSNAAVPTQSFANHRAADPVYLMAGAILASEVALRIVDATKNPHVDTIWHALAAASVVIVWRASRRKAQIVQDRVIRLEMRLRLERVLPPQQRGDIDRLTLGQLIALRFASDAELPALVTAVLAEGITKRDDIKRRIRDWQPDWLRA